MTLVAPRSRQGRLLLVLAICAAVLATAGALLWANSAQATLPTPVVTLSQVPPSPGFILPGQTVTYTMMTTTSGPNTNGDVVMTINLGSGLINASSTVTCPADNTVADGGLTITWTAGGAGTGTLTCTSSAILTDPLTGATMTASATAAGSVGTGNGNVHDAGANSTVNATSDGTVGPLSAGSLRHLDIPDAGTEDAAGVDSAGIPPCPANNNGTGGFLPNGVCGLLKNQDDIDDATGSFHGACIENTALTFAVDNAQITWSITPVAGGPAPVSITPFPGPSGEPCVEWGAAGTGTQDITATWTDPATATTFTFFWNGSCSAGICGGDAGVITNPLPLVKEWNTIDSTRIVRPATGDLGSNPSNKIAGNTGGAADWVQRNCSTVPLVPTGGGDCVLANLDGLTLPVGGSFILNSNNGSFITAGGTTFIDYTMGHHADAGGAYTGPVDGAQQTYTISGDCGSVRLEDPSTGNIIVLSNKEGTDPDQLNPSTFTILSSDKGVAFEFVPNDTGALGTTIGNADCGPNSTICVTIATFNEANVFTSTPKEVSITETICVNFTVGPPTNKTPILAWAGQRVVLENYWGDPSTAVACPGFNGIATGGGVVLGLDFFTDTSKEFITGNPCGLNGRLVTFTGGPGAGQSGRIITTDHQTLTVVDSVTGLALATQLGPGTVYSIAPIQSFHPCPVAQGEGGFGVLYSKQNGPGGFTGQLVHENNRVIQTNDNAIVQVNPFPQPTPDGVTDPNSNCTSRIIIESEDQGEVDVSAFVVDPNSNLADARPLSQQVAFVIYFMKFESEQLQLIPDSNPATDAFDTGGTPTTDPVTATVSDNVAAAVHVKGWVLTDNCPGDAAHAARTGTGHGDGQVGEFFPANRCIFPDDWAFKAGAFSQLPQCGPSATLPVPQQCRPEFDIASDSSGAYSCPDDHVAGPFSLLDQITHAGLPVGCGESLAPYPPANAGGSASCLTPFLTYACRNSNFPDGTINATDAPMPPALIQFDLNGSGFLKGIGKAAGGQDTGFNSAAIPAEPWISQTNSDGEGYVWNTWGAGGNSGLYNYWTSLASHGPEVVSCAGPAGTTRFVDPSNPSTNPCSHDPAPIGPCQAAGVGVGCVRTGGFGMTEVYSDEHGVAMSLINGDANLTFSSPGCTNSTPVSGTTTPIVLLNGFFCTKGAVVGTSTLTSVVDYPDKRKHFAELTNSDTINWTWNGTKDVTVCQDVDATHHCQPETPGSGSQFHYVVFHVTDRDGFCGGGNSLHPVLGEQVDFRIDSTTGSIVPDVNGHSAEGPVATGGTVAADGKSATTQTFDTAANPTFTIGTPLTVGECQAWIHISESLLNRVNVIVTASDPEGTVTFDTIVNPTPVPTASPTPAPTASPFTLHLKWGDSDCSGTVAPRDGQAILLHFLDQTELSQTQPCPSMGETVMIAGNVQHWGDFDCSGAVAPRDGQAVLFFFLNKTALSNTPPCPTIGDPVDVQLIQP